MCESVYTISKTLPECQADSVHVLCTCQKRPIFLISQSAAGCVSLGVCVYLCPYFRICMCVACWWHTCHFKAEARCRSTGTGTPVGGTQTVHYCIITFMHIYSCRNTMAAAFLRCCKVPCLHLWSSFDGPVCWGTFQRHYKSKINKNPRSRVQTA